MCRLLIFSLLFLSVNIAVGQSGYKIDVQLKHFKNATLYHGNYYGKNTFLVDSARIDGDGEASFKGDKDLPSGIYFVLLPKKQKYFEILLDKDDRFSIVADSANQFNNLVFSHSPVNEMFREYNSYIRDQQKEVAKAAQAGADSSAIAAKKEEVGNNIQAYRNKIIKEHPATFLATLFKAMKDPIVPKKPKHNSDTAFGYHYFKKHYWDGIDFSDSSIIRTPILETRLHRYFTRLVPPVPDSVNREADAILAKAKQNKEMFKFVLWWLTSTYEKSPYMGMDAVFVHLVEKYYVHGDAYWIEQKQLDKIIDKAAKIAPNLIGNTAPELDLKTPDLQEVKLSDVKAEYVILVFWDPTCGHCKVIVPRLDSAYKHSWKQMGVEMVGVLAGGTKEQWLDFIKKHKLSDWVNLWDPKQKNLYRQLYDVYQTPVIYLLDKNKKIKAKKLDVKQLEEVLNHLEKG